METGLRLKVSSDRLEKPGIKPAIHGLQGQWFLHYIMEASYSIAISLQLTVGIKLLPFSVGIYDIMCKTASYKDNSYY